jgi:hypothetical protein
VIFGERKNCKSLLQKGLKIYGIFKNSKIVQSHLVKKARKPSSLAMAVMGKKREQENRE